jgi:TolA-binding protein
MHALHRQLTTQLKQTDKIYSDTFMRNVNLEQRFSQLNSSVNQLKLNKMEQDSNTNFYKDRAEILAAELSTKKQILSNVY